MSLYVFRIRDPGSWPVWCHHCGCYSFVREWGFGGDVCPVCGDNFPAMARGPLYDQAVREARAAGLGLGDSCRDAIRRLEEAAREHECVY